jgi:hypothetical protein
MVSVKRARLRFEPYNANSVDGDGDGIVQEGTAWERPVGTRLLDEFGQEIRGGLTSSTRPANSRVVDRAGRDVEFTPSYGNRVLKPGQQSPLGKIGYRSLEERGLPNIGQVSGQAELGPKLDSYSRNLDAINNPVLAAQEAESRTE